MSYSLSLPIGEVSCGCTEHNGRTILNEVYNSDVETTFQLLFTDSDFFRGFLKARKTTSNNSLSSILFS